MRYRLAFLLGTFLVTDVASAPISMICENPRREYLFVFDIDARIASADGTNYRVLGIENTDERLLIIGLPGNDSSLTFRAHIRPYKKIEFFSDDQLFQTDGCR